MNQYYYRNLKDNSKIIRVYENEAPDWNEWEQISDREATQSARIAELEAALKEIHDAVGVYINNPSAWENFDQSVSDVLRYQVYNKSLKG